MDRSVDKFPEGQAPQGLATYPQPGRARTPLLSVAEIAELVALRMAAPRVRAWELAEELGVTASQLSLFENHRAALPHGIGAESVRTAIRRVREKRGEVAA